MVDFAAEPFTEAFVAELVAATADRPLIPGLSGDIGLGIGSKVDASKVAVVIAIVDGRVTGPTERPAEAIIGLSKKQVPQWLSGELVLASEYMKGDLKPTGASGAIFAGLELLDWVTSGVRS